MSQTSSHRNRCYGIGCYVSCRLFTNNTTLTTADTSVAPSYVRRYVLLVTASVTLRSALSSVVTLIGTATSGSTTSSSVWLNSQPWSVRRITCAFSRAVPRAKQLTWSVWCPSVRGRLQTPLPPHLQISLNLDSRLHAQQKYYVQPAVKTDWLKWLPNGTKKCFFSSDFKKKNEPIFVPGGSEQLTFLVQNFILPSNFFS